MKNLPSDISLPRNSSSETRNSSTRRSATDKRKCLACVPTEVADFDLRSPLQSAIYERNLEMTRLLLDAHADYEYTSTFGANALMYLWYPEDPCTASAAFLSMFSNVGIKFDLDLYDTQGFSALELAVASGDANFGNKQKDGDSGYYA